jgi:hypothetical protein
MTKYSQPCVQKPPLGLKKFGRCPKAMLIRGWSLKITINVKKLEITPAVVDRWPLIRGGHYHRFDSISNLFLSQQG